MVEREARKGRKLLEKIDAGSIDTPLYSVAKETCERRQTDVTD